MCTDLFVYNYFPPRNARLARRYNSRSLFNKPLQRYYFDASWLTIVLFGLLRHTLQWVVVAIAAARRLGEVSKNDARVHYVNTRIQG